MVPNWQFAPKDLKRRKPTRQVFPNEEEHGRNRKWPWTYQYGSYIVGDVEVRQFDLCRMFLLNEASTGVGVLRLFLNPLLVPGWGRGSGFSLSHALLRWLFLVFM